MKTIDPDMGILITAYDRPDVLSQTLSSIRRQIVPGSAKFYLSLDGPANKSKDILVGQCRDLFEEFAIGTGSVEALYSSVHLGLRANVLSSVTKAFESSERLLVLEDDCLVGDSTLDFFSWGFERLMASNQIGAISATYFGPRNDQKSFLADRFASWGWATTRTIWKQFMAHRFSSIPVSTLSKEIQYLTRKSPLPYKYDYRRLVKKLASLDSWAVPFDMFLRSLELKTIKPGVNQIQNIGFGQRATHTSRGSRLSIPTDFFDVKSAELVDDKQSKRLEAAESRRKFLLLTQEYIFDK